MRYGVGVAVSGFLLCLAAQPVWAVASVEPVTESPGYISRSVNYLLTQHRNISSEVSLMARQIDAYLAGDQALAEDNESYIRVRVAEQSIEGGKWNPENDFKFRLDLPATKRRYRLLLAYRPDENKSLADRTQPSVAAQPDRGDKSLIAGAVHSVKNEAKHWEARALAGIKVRWPLDPFVRVDGKREIQLDADWQLRIRAGAGWFLSSGYGADNSWDFDRILAPKLLFRAGTAFQWLQTNDTLEFAEVWDVFHTLDDRHLLDYQIGALGTSGYHPHMDKYYASIIYRQDLYRKFLFLNVIPEVAYPREKDFAATVSFTVGIEIFFNQF